MIRKTNWSGVRAVARMGRHVWGEMNGTERAYADELEIRKRSGSVARWEFETHTFTLAKGLRFTPDFWVVLPCGTIEFHEVKGGHRRDDAMAKLKMFATRYPEYGVFLCERARRGQGFRISEIEPLEGYHGK